MSRKEKQMKELLELSEQLSKMEDCVLIDNDTDDPLVNSYNAGVMAMATKIAFWLNTVLLTKKDGEQDG